MKKIFSYLNNQFIIVQVRLILFFGIIEVLRGNLCIKIIFLKEFTSIKKWCYYLSILVSELMKYSVIIILVPFVQKVRIKYLYWVNESVKHQTYYIVIIKSRRLWFVIQIAKFCEMRINFNYFYCLTAKITLNYEAPISIIS